MSTGPGSLRTSPKRLLKTWEVHGRLSVDWLGVRGEWGGAPKGSVEKQGCFQRRRPGDRPCRCWGSARVSRRANYPAQRTAGTRVRRERRPPPPKNTGGRRLRRLAAREERKKRKPFRWEAKGVRRGSGCWGCPLPPPAAPPHAGHFLREPHVSSCKPTSCREGAFIFPQVKPGS